MDKLKDLELFLKLNHRNNDKEFFDIFLSLYDKIEKNSKLLECVMRFNNNHNRSDTVHEYVKSQLAQFQISADTLIRACKSECYDYFEILMSRIDFKEIAYSETNELISILTQNQDFNLLDKCVKKGLDINIDGHIGQHILFRETDNIGNFKQLVKIGADIHKIDKYGRTLLYPALQKDKSNLTKFLLDKGLDFNIIDVDGNNMFMAVNRTSFINDDNEYLILKYKTLNVNVINNDGQSFLVVAILNESFKLAKFLINQGADVNIEYTNSSKLCSALSLSLDNIEMIDELCKAGANLENSEGYHLINDAKSDAAKALIEKHILLRLTDEDDDEAMGL